MNDDHARQRFIAINLIRLSGMAMVLIAIAIHYRKIDAPEELAWALAALGVIEFFFVPQFLARRWRTPDR